jgi:hypothetical protein
VQRAAAEARAAANAGGGASLQFRFELVRKPSRMGSTPFQNSGLKTVTVKQNRCGCVQLLAMSARLVQAACGPGKQTPVAPSG